MTISIHLDDYNLLQSVLSVRTPVLYEFFKTHNTKSVSRVVQELRVLGRTITGPPGQVARDLVPQLLKADVLHLEVGQ